MHFQTEALAESVVAFECMSDVSKSLAAFRVKQIVKQTRNNRTEFVSNNSLDDCDLSTAKIEWSVGGNVLHPTKASRTLHAIMSQSMQDKLLKSTNVPLFILYFLREFAMHGARDVLMCMPTYAHYSCLSTGALNYLVSIRLNTTRGCLVHCGLCGRDDVQNLIHHLRCSAGCAGGHRTRRHEEVVSSLEIELKKNKHWSVQRTEALFGDERACDRVHSRKADLSFIGPLTSKAVVTQVHMDMRTVGVLAQSHCNLDEVTLSSCSSSPSIPDLATIVKKAEDAKFRSYSSQNLNGAWFQPVVLTAFGGMSRKLLRTFHLIAYDLVLSESESSGSSFVPSSDHILVSLKAQQLRRSMALAACEQSYLAYAKISRSGVFV